MSKRFTDSKKWMNSWFTSLTLEAKLAWIYLCDECDLSGVIEPNYAIARYQLGFEINAAMLTQWFNGRLFQFDEKLLIVQYFEFQYGSSKNSWSAKIQSKEKLENLGFYIEANHKGDWVKIYDPKLYFREIAPPQYTHSGGTLLNTVKGKGIKKAQSMPDDNAGKLSDKGLEDAIKDPKLKKLVDVMSKSKNVPK